MISKFVMVAAVGCLAGCTSPATPSPPAPDWYGGIAFRAPRLMSYSGLPASVGIGVPCCPDGFRAFRMRLSRDTWGTSCAGDVMGNWTWACVDRPQSEDVGRACETATFWRGRLDADRGNWPDYEHRIAFWAGVGEANGCGG